jgi:hypothetical protein
MLILTGEGGLFEDAALRSALLSLGLPVEPMAAGELAALSEEAKEKKEPADAIGEARAHLAELVAAGKPSLPKTGEKPDSVRVGAHLSTRPGNCSASVSFSLRCESEKATQRFEAVKGQFPKAIRDTAFDRMAGGGQQHYSFRQENARVSFRLVPGRPRGSYGCTVYVRAATPQKAKQYFATLVSGLPPWARASYRDSLSHKHEGAEAEPAAGAGYLEEFFAGEESDGLVLV